MLNEDYQIHDRLNEKLWDSAGLLLPEVRAKIVEIVKAFEQDLSIPVHIVDILLVGSNAGFDYTPTSDLDVHIIANYELVSNKLELVGTVYELEKSSFNKNHDITIHGISIELYVLDINTGINSNGVYSVLDNQWIKEPKPMKSASKKNIEKELNAWKTHIAKVIIEKDDKLIVNAINTLYLIRHNAIAAEGPQSKGNQLFKEIRSLGLLDKLKDAHIQLMDKELSLESYKSGCSNGELIRILEG